MKCYTCPAEMKEVDSKLEGADMQPAHAFVCKDCDSTVLLFDAGTSTWVRLWLQECEDATSVRALVAERAAEQRV